MPVMRKLIEGQDFYINQQGLYVFTASYLQERGYCCENVCKHCPYGYGVESASKASKPSNHSNQSIQSIESNQSKPPAKTIKKT